MGEGVDLPTEDSSSTTATGEARSDAGGSAESDSTDAAAQDGGSTTGFAITVRGPDGRPRAGVPAAVSGRIQRSIVSDADGVLRLSAPGGHYEIVIEPTCTPEVQVETGASAKVAVPVGEVVRGELTVSAKRRHFPGGPVTYEAQRPTRATEEAGRQWKLGVTYLVRFTMIDRCSGTPSPGASVEGLVFETDDALEVRLQEAPTADADAKAVLAAICRSEGEELELLAADRTHPGDRVDLFSRTALDETAPSCVR